MLHEALESPKVVAAQLAENAPVRTLVDVLAANPCQVVLTVARGSSDHAASYFSYLAISRLGIPVVSLPMSIATLQKAPFRVKGQLALAFSQSGKSPDLVATMGALRAAGARTAAAVNVTPSPLAEICEWQIPLLAGAELSVAATKSYIAMLSISAQIVAYWERSLSGDEALSDALAALPGNLHEAVKLDWTAGLDVLRGVEKMIVVGRGTGLAVAQEAALKFKETSGIQAEAFSGAELRHGPMEIIGSQYPILVFAPRGPEQAGLIQLAEYMRARGAKVLLAAPTAIAGANLPILETAHPALDPIAAALSFYTMAAELAVNRGRNPDTPLYLQKVTETF